MQIGRRGWREARGPGGVGEGGVLKTPDLRAKAMVVAKHIDHSFAFRCNGASSSPNLHSLLFSRSFDV